MSRTSEYTIDLIIKDDKTKDAIRELEKSMKGVGEIAKKSIGETDFSKSLEASQKAADAAIAKFHEMAKDSELDFDAISKAYAKNSKKAFDALESQYASISQWAVGTIRYRARGFRYRQVTIQ